MLQKADPEPAATTVCTLFEGNDLPGVCALANSLVESGFTGVFAPGTRRGAAWVEPLREIVAKAQAHPDVRFEVELHEFDTEMHLTNYKPWLMKHVFDARPPSADADRDAVLYFDPDIVLGVGWHFFDNWVQNGVALAADLNWFMPHDYPHRHVWRDHARALGFEPDRELDLFFNGGFCGVTRPNAAFLDTWITLIESAAEAAGGLDVFRAKRRDAPFQSANQDTLNVAAMCWPGRLSTVGPDGMAFAPGYHPMGHALGRPKPWTRNYTMTALRGKKPRVVDSLYWKVADGPFEMYSPGRVRRKRLDLSFGKAVSRLLGSS
ncbi:MAG: hypothetical protein AAFX76_13350 [Planctomycetota bacterium]